MCGRFVQFSPYPVVALEFNLEGPEVDLRPCFNIAPTRNVATVVNEDGNRLAMCRWGLIPHWAKDISIGNRMINARAETVAEKPSFKGPFRNQRCIVVADGFFEWRKDGGKKVPVYIRLKDRRPLGFAGLNSFWHPPEGDAIRSCTIITTRPNRLLEGIHDRMPAILPSGSRDLWLAPEVDDPKTLNALLKPFDPEAMEAFEVSPRVNSPANDSPGNIEPKSSFQAP